MVNRKWMEGFRIPEKGKLMKRYLLLGFIVAITPIMQSVSANAADLFVPAPSYGGGGYGGYGGGGYGGYGGGGWGGCGWSCQAPRAGWGGGGWNGGGGWGGGGGGWNGGGGGW
jgi:hypothetical protein